MKFRMLKANEIECRVATLSEKGCSLLLYKDARADMNLLDETVGPENWQRTHELINGSLFCNVGIKIDGEWIWKQDVGTESNTEKEKGQASDSFKRACVNWGLGRELYTAPFIWVSDVKIENENGKKRTNDRFAVKDIGYDESGSISSLTIVNSKSHKVVYTFGNKSATDVKKETKKEEKEEHKGLTQMTDDELRAMFLRYINNNNYSEEDKNKLCSCYKVEGLLNMPGNYCRDYLDKLQKKGKNIYE